MSTTMDRRTITGIVAYVPEVHYSESTGIPVCTIVINDNITHKSKGGWVKKRTNRYEVVLFNEFAEYAAVNLKAGMPILAVIRDEDLKGYKKNDGAYGGVIECKGVMLCPNPITETTSIAAMNAQKNQPAPQGQTEPATLAKETARPAAPAGRGTGTRRSAAKTNAKEAEAERTGRPVNHDADKPLGIDLITCKNAQCGNSGERRVFTKAGYCPNCKADNKAKRAKANA